MIVTLGWLTWPSSAVVGLRTCYANISDMCDPDVTFEDRTDRVRTVVLRTRLGITLVAKVASRVLYDPHPLLCN